MGSGYGLKLYWMSQIYSTTHTLLHRNVKTHRLRIGHSPAVKTKDSNYTTFAKLWGDSTKKSSGNIATAANLDTPALGLITSCTCVSTARKAVELPASFPRDFPTIQQLSTILFFCWTNTDLHETLVFMLRLYAPCAYCSVQLLRLSGTTKPILHNKFHDQTVIMSLDLSRKQDVVVQWYGYSSCVNNVR